MELKFKVKGNEIRECDVEVFSNENGIVVKFFDKKKEPKADRIIDYVFVEAGYGYISLKRKSEDGIMSGFLKKDFFSDSLIIDLTRDFLLRLLPDLEEAYVPYNLERIVVEDAKIWTGETFQDIVT